MITPTQQLMNKSSASSDSLPASSLVAVDQPGQLAQLNLNVQAEAAASPAVNAGEGTCVECVFGCGPPRLICYMTNTGTAINPRWMCFPCNGARKAIEHQVRKDKALKDNLGTLKRNDPDLWRHKVRSCRIRDANDPPGTTGVLNLDARRAIINRLKVTLAQKVAVQDIQQRKPMNKNSLWLLALHGR